MYVSLMSMLLYFPPVCFLVDIVQRVNESLDKDTVKETHTLLQKPEGKFPEVLNRSAFLYHCELRKVKQHLAKVRF